MPRIARIAPKECIYHILTRGNNRQNVFKEDVDYLKYLEILKKYKEKYLFKLYHFVLMSNHIHLVLKTTETSGHLAEIMKSINLSYAQYYKKKYNHIGHFWQDRYKSIIVDQENYLLACGSYVELNPVRANIVKDPKDYRWSSYNVYAYGKKNDLIDECVIYEEFSEDETKRREKYQEFVKKMIKEKDAMRGEMDKKSLYGGKNFIEEMRLHYNIEEYIKPKGRPKK